MPTPSRVVRRPQNTLVVFEGPPATTYKLSQNDVLRVEQHAGIKLETLTQGRLSAAMNSLGVTTLPLDRQDWVEMAAESAPAAPGQPATQAPAVQTTRPVGQPPPPVVPSSGPLDPSGDEEAGSPKLRVGLLIAVLALAGVVLLILFGILRLFSSPGSGSTDATPTTTVTVTTTLTGTPSPGAAKVIAVGNVDITSGPGKQYPVVGVLPAGATAPVVGRNPNGDWYVIAVPGLPGGQGWVPASAVVAENTGAVPLATPPPLPTATAIPTALPTVPTVFQGWKGEYFANPDVIEPPVVVRDDPQINFNWGPGSPAPGVPPNGYSVRWSRRAAFEEGSYTFIVNVEGGVRLWLDGRLLIDSWQSGPLRLEQASSGAIARGDHDLRVDYRKLSGNGQIAVSWQIAAAGPPTAAIEGPTVGQVGQELRFSARNSTAAAGTQIAGFDWRFGDGSGASTMDVAKVYNAPGVYEVVLTVTASNGLTGQARQQVTIAPQPEPPVAVINAPAQGVAGQPVTFDGSPSTGSFSIVSYQWRFGDGGTATGATAQHTYAAQGVYTVQLTVVDSTGLSGSTSVQIQINPPPTVVPTVQPEPTAVITPIPLDGPVWQLRDTLAGTTITAIFRDGRLSGSGGCNEYSGSFTVSGQAMAIGPFGTTNQACPQPVLDQETQYFATLQGAVEYEIEDNELRIDCQVGDQRIRLRYAAS